MVSSKEDILAQHEYDVHYYGGGRRHVLEAMDIFAKTVAIEFAKWMQKSNCAAAGAHLWTIDIEPGNRDRKMYSSKHLFELFIEETKQNQI